MGQTATPTSFTSVTWTGTAASLADASDATYVESPSSPTSAQTFLCALSGVIDPGIDTGHQVLVRAKVDTAGATYALVVALENSDDSSTVATWTIATVGEAISEVALPLTAAQAADIHSYAGLQVRVYATPGTGGGTIVYFTWPAVTGATTYKLQIGNSTNVYDIYNDFVGNVLTYPYSLASGTYFSNVVPYNGATPMDALGEQEVNV